jgi:hypothetical protein
MLTFLNFDQVLGYRIANISLRQRHFYLNNDNGKLDHSSMKLDCSTTAKLLLHGNGALYVTVFSVTGCALD